MKSYLLLKLFILLFFQVNSAYSQCLELERNVNLRISKIIAPGGAPFVMLAKKENFEENMLQDLVRNREISKEEIEGILVRAAERGCEAVVESILFAPELDIKKNWAFYQAIRHDKTKVVKIFLNNVSFDQEIIDSAFGIAVIRGSLEIIEMCLTNSLKPTQKAIDKAYKSIGKQYFFYWNDDNSSCAKKKLLKKYISSHLKKSTSQPRRVSVPFWCQDLAVPQVIMVPVVAFPYCNIGTNPVQYPLRVFRGGSF